MREPKPIERSTFLLWAVLESGAIAAAFVCVFVLQQSQIASILFGGAIFSFFYRGLNYRIRKD